MYRAVGVETAEPYLNDPVEVPGLTDVAAVATCGDASLVLKRDVEDTGSAVLRFRSGAIGSVVTTEAIATERISRIEIHGTTGAAVWENNSWLRWEPAI